MLVRNLPLLDAWSWLAFVVHDAVQHDLVWKVCVVGGVALAPVVADCVSKNVSVVGEAGTGNGAADGWVSLKAVLSVLVPEVECAVRSCGGESAVNRVEGDSIDRVHVRHVARWWVAVALKREVEAVYVSEMVLYGYNRTYLEIGRAHV